MSGFAFFFCRKWLAGVVALLVMGGDQKLFVNWYTFAAL